MFFFVGVGFLHLFWKSLLPSLMPESNEIMPQSQYNDAEKGGFFVGFVREVPPYNSKHCKSIKGIFAFLTCRAKTTFFNTAKQKISSDPNTIKVSVVRYALIWGE